MHQNIKRYFLFLLLLLSTSTALWSQLADLKFQAEHLGGTMILKWAPVRPTLWDSLNTIGYTLERTELDAGSNPIPSTKTIVANKIMPKDSIWFAQNGDDYFGTMGMLLYDSTFQWEDNEVLNSTKMRYDYLVHEAQLAWQPPAFALGLAIEDTTMVDGKFYQYRIYAEQYGQIIVSEELFMDAESGIFVGTRPIPEDAFQYNFPNGKSLLDMSGKLTEDEVDQVFMDAKPMGDSVILRWAPNHAQFWEESMRNGFQITRYEGEDLDSNTVKRFDPVFAKKEAELGAWISQDSMALVAAQVMYGGVAGAAAASIYDQSALYNNRFGMALYAAERSALAADILGFRFVDRAVEPDKKYTYFIEVIDNYSVMQGDYLELVNTPIPEPTPVGFIAEAKDKKITLIWNKPDNDLNFSTYQVEKSSDGGQTWAKMNQRPVLIMEDESSPITDYRYVDTAVTNYQTYHYRLRGFTTFAVLGEPATTTAMPRDLTPPPAPWIRQGALSEDETQIDLVWELEGEQPNDLAGYYVLLNDELEGLGDTISDFLPPFMTEFTYTLPDSVLFNGHYFSVAAVDTAGNEVISFPQFIMVPDKYPPLPPENIYGHIDSAGNVTIVWDHSPSSDVTNYHVLTANNPEDEYSMLTGVENLEENIFYDTLSLRAIDKYVYYVVLAEDQSYLRSEASNVLRLERPDVIPPSKPILRKPTQEENGLKLVWLPSSSEDVVGHEIYRRPFQNDAEWELLVAVDTTMKTWTDTTTQLEKMYQYSMRAKDDANLLSVYSYPQKGIRQFRTQDLVVQSLQAVYNSETKNIDLNWAFSDAEEKPTDLGNANFYLYKSYGALELDLIRELDGQTLQLSDEEVSLGAIHNYAIMVVYDNGLMGPVCDAVSVLPAEEED